MATTVPSHRRASRTAIKVAFLVIGVALIGAIGVAVLRPGWIASALKGRIEQVASKSIGLPVTIGSIEAKLFPKPGATLKDFKIAGGPNEPPLVEANSASATAQLWPLIRSLGKEVRVDDLVLERATVNLVRREDGTWNYEDIQSEPSAEPSAREVYVSTVALEESEIRVVDHQAKGGTATVALRQIDLEIENVGPGQTMEIEGAAALASNQQNVTLDLDVESPMGKPEGYFPTIDGELEMKGVRVSAFKLFLPAKAASLFTGGSANGKVELGTTEQRHYAVNGSMNVDRLRLRGEPAQGAMKFSSTIDPANASAATVDISQMSVKGPGVELGGNATVQLKPLAMEFAVKGPLLDLGELLAVMPADPDEDEAAQKELLPPELRKQVGAMSIKGSLQIDEVRRGKLTARSLDARGQLDDGVFGLQSGTAQVFGGTADLTGTRVDLNPRQPEWSLRAKVNGLDVGQAFSMLSGHQAVAGKAHVELQLDGEGVDWQSVSKAMSGNGSLQLLDGALTSVDMGEKIAPALAAGLRKLGKEGVAGTVEKAGKGTELKDLRTSFAIRDGFMTLNKPITFRSSAGTFELGGRIGLDQRVDLDGKVTASPELVARATRGMLRNAVPLPLSVDGTLRQPDVKPGAPGNLVKSLARNPPEPVRREVEKVKETAKDRAKQGIDSALDRLRRRP